MAQCMSTIAISGFDALSKSDDAPARSIQSTASREGVRGDSTPPGIAGYEYAALGGSGLPMQLPTATCEVAVCKLVTISQTWSSFSAVGQVFCRSTRALRGAIDIYRLQALHARSTSTVQRHYTSTRTTRSHLGDPLHQDSVCATVRLCNGPACGKAERPAEFRALLMTRRQSAIASCGDRRDGCLQGAVQGHRASDVERKTAPIAPLNSKRV
ncbi:hypothetical protein AC579_1432 [Pseudocercospora musae]|uniref:Uncharacterized protein n=1 Tax=Pseudocercospora musae TaxID=113226 RepID=A0A139IMI0_9PEZI|nr:hypothetical protein AC579_1432 [Pseudocercospora musae]